MFGFQALCSGLCRFWCGHEEGQRLYRWHRTFWQQPCDLREDRSKPTGWYRAPCSGLCGRREGLHDLTFARCLGGRREGLHDLTFARCLGGRREGLHDLTFARCLLQNFQYPQKEKKSPLHSPKENCHAPVMYSKSQMYQRRLILAASAANTATFATFASLWQVGARMEWEAQFWQWFFICVHLGFAAVVLTFLPNPQSKDWPKVFQPMLRFTSAGGKVCKRQVLVKAGFGTRGSKRQSVGLKREEESLCLHCRLIGSSARAGSLLIYWPSSVTRTLQVLQSSSQCQTKYRPAVPNFTVAVQWRFPPIPPCQSCP